MTLFWILSLFLASGDDSWPPAVWSQPTEPFHIAGPVYYVGGRELTAYLVVDGQELLLVNVGMADNVPLVMASIRELGFNPNHLDTLLITQAHMDHAGGAAALQRQTGCEVVVGTGDVALMTGGGRHDPVFGDELPFEAVAQTRGVGHGDTIQCGEFTLETVATPGHTPGSSSWLLKLDQQGKPLNILFQGSISLLPKAFKDGKEVYPGMVSDFERSMRRLTSISAHVTLPDHMVFAHPKGTTHEDTVDPAWFRRSDIIQKQVARTKKALKRNQ